MTPGMTKTMEYFCGHYGDCGHTPHAGCVEHCSWAAVFAGGFAHGRQAEKAECIKMLEERGREAREDYDEARRLFPDDLAHAQWGIWNEFQQFLHVLRNKDAGRGFLIMSDTKPLCPLLFQGKVDPTCIEAKCAWYATNRKQCVLIAITEAILSSNILGSKTGTKHE